MRLNLYLYCICVLLKVLLNLVYLFGSLEIVDYNKTFFDSFLMCVVCTIAFQSSTELFFTFVKYFIYSAS